MALPSERYRKWAEECRRNAIVAKTADLEAGWRQLESAWLALAQRADAEQKRKRFTGLPDRRGCDSTASNQTHAAWRRDMHPSRPQGGSP
jgi:hypothetical protein